MADPAFQALGTLYYTSYEYSNSLSTVITNVSVGDLILVGIQRNYQADCTGVASSSPALTFSLIKYTADLSYGFRVDLWAAIATQATSSMTITASYSSSSSWGTIYSARWSNAPSSITPVQSYADTTLHTTSTNRTITDITTTQRTLLIVAGTDWDYYRSHTAAANWTKRVDSQTFGANTTTQYFYERIADVGTYPNGNYGTVNATDAYIAVIVALPISTSGTVVPVFMNQYRQRRS